MGKLHAGTVSTYNSLISQSGIFFNHRNPNGMNAEQTWKPVITSDVEYIYINKSQCFMKSKPFWDDYLFWKNLGNPPLINSSIYETIFLGDLKRKPAS